MHTGGVGQWLSWSSDSHENMSSCPQHPHKKADVVAHTSKPSIEEAEAGGL